MKPITFQIHTFGCKVNTYDTGLLQKRFEKIGFSQDSNSYVHVINTCAVTAEATREALRLARKLKKQNPQCRVIMTGCSAQVDTEKLLAEPSVDLIVANSHKGEIETHIESLLRGHSQDRLHKSNIFKKEALEGGGGIEKEHTRAFLKIQDGCNSFCSFCVIPFARGKSRSLPVDELVEQVERLQALGYQEVVLTGVHIGDYEDQGKNLANLVRNILVRTNVPRIRLSSLEPVELTDELIELFGNDRLCPHFHMSIQSANSRVLEAMKRSYTSREVEASLLLIEQKCPGAFVGMDVIAGFPGESALEFQDTCSRLEGLPWTRLHVFPFSPRPGTLAAKIDSDPQASHQRAKVLHGISRRRFSTEALHQKGKIKQVLVLNRKSSVQAAWALSRDYWKVQLSEPPAFGKEIQVQIIGIEGFDSKDGSPHLTAEPLTGY